MSKTVSKFALAAGIALAVAFTFLIGCGEVVELASLQQRSDGGKGNNISNYRTVVIGNQIWMAENLDFAVEGSKCYNNDPANCAKYGRLYNWETAMTACPSGWYLPSNAEWAVLENYVGGSSTAGRKLKATSGWSSNGNGTNEYGFSALPGGSGRGFRSVGNLGNWWVASESSSNSAYVRFMLYSGENVFRYDASKSHMFSVRCVQG